MDSIHLTYIQACKGLRLLVHLVLHNFRCRFRHPYFRARQPAHLTALRCLGESLLVVEEALRIRIRHQEKSRYMFKPATIQRVNVVHDDLNRLVMSVLMLRVAMSRRHHRQTRGVCHASWHGALRSPTCLVRGSVEILSAFRSNIETNRFNAVA